MPPPVRLCASTVTRFALALLLCAFLNATTGWAQTDQGAITGTVADPSGAVVPGASVTLNNVDTGLVLQRKTDDSGVYTFAPVKIGNYTLTVESPGFQKLNRSNIHVDIQQRLEVDLKLTPGSAGETITVETEPPLLQTEDASSGQVIDARTINATPLNGRNWVFMAQLTAGVTASSGSRGQGTGDFSANGQRAEQNNFILDGVDNNVNVVDFLNGASFVVRPPPDALAEFKVQTGSYDAEFGHSAGAVINASIKSGTNNVHGDLWEYWRNDILDARDYFATSVPAYRQNQFGATLGLPIIKDRLFFFGDTEATRIVFAQPSASVTVPTQLMRQGNFSELLNTGLTGSAQPVQLYQPGSANTATPLNCNGQNNVLCPSQINAVAQRILNLYPLPNAGNGRTYNNYTYQFKIPSNVFQYDLRMDWNISSKDQAYSRFSYSNAPSNYPSPLGPILDGGSYGSDGSIRALGENFMLSETHNFNSTLINEFRFGYNYGHFSDTQPNANVNTAEQVGLGGIPFAPLNGGLPATSISGISGFGAPQYYAANEYENVFQILDNVTKVQGNHTIKAGVSLQHIRFYTLAPTASRGYYNYSGKYTSVPGKSFTGSGVADFLADQQDSAAISNFSGVDQMRWSDGAYAEDSWKLNKLTVNYGVRFEFAQPYLERHDRQASFYPTAPLTPGSSTGVFVLPGSQRGLALPSSFTSLLAGSNVSVGYDENRQLVQAQYTNFAPRFGVTYNPSSKVVARIGYGIFFGGLESTGGAPNLGFNFPFQFTSSIYSGNCLQNNCPTDGITLTNGFSQQLAAGLVNSVSSPTIVGSERKAKTPYSQQYNLALEYAFRPTLVAQVAYVGSTARHLIVAPDQNASAALIAPGLNSNNFRPFPTLGTIYFNRYAGTSNYNSLQSKLEKRFSGGLSFLATYTYSHSLDDATTPLGSTGDGGYRNVNLIGIEGDYSNSPWDARHRVTFNGTYDLPFGHGRKYANNSRLEDLLIGSWSGTLTFRAQTGQPFTVYNNNASANGAGARAIVVGDPFKAGGTPDATNPGITCPNKVRTLQNWYNPCAFANPPDGANITGTQQITGYAAVPYLGGRRNSIYGPGYQVVDMSLFKSFPIVREQYLQFRADGFNMLNTPAYGVPNGGIGSNGGLITSTRYFQPNSPSARFFQLALKYVF